MTTLRRWLLAALAMSAGAGCILSADPDPTDPEQNDTQIIAAGYSYGECLGHCRADLDVGETTTLTFTSNNDEPSIINTGTLAAATLAELDALAETLASADLAETYGCPDCDDGGAAWIDVLGGDIVERSTYERGAPPAILSDADAVIDALIDALSTCVSTERITIETCIVP